MPETPEELYARVVAEVGAQGRLPGEDPQAADMFPWEVVDGALVTKVLEAPLPGERPRLGEDPERPCVACQGPTDEAPWIWENDRWFVSSRDASGLPLVLFLQAKAHLDYPDMDDELASECGRLSARLCRIMSNLPNVGRVHVCRWGDGVQHLHVWFIARPERFRQIIGSMAVEWDELLPPPPPAVRDADTRDVARRLATHDGRALV